MNVENRAESALIIEKEYINGIFVAVPWSTMTEISIHCKLKHSVKNNLLLDDKPTVSEQNINNFPLQHFSHAVIYTLVHPELRIFQKKIKLW